MTQLVILIVIRLMISLLSATDWQLSFTAISPPLIGGQGVGVGVKRGRDSLLFNSLSFKFLKDCYMKSVKIGFSKNPYFK